MRSLRVWIVLALVLALVPAGAWAKKKKAEDEAPEEQAKLSAPTFAGLKLRSIGPALMSGRIADIAVHPDDPATWYVAVGSGGVWKTTNRGTTWTPLFDGESSYSIGCVTIDPNRPETIWVGTGENVGGRHVGYGDGVYRSRGRRAAPGTNLGLAREVPAHRDDSWCDPQDSDTVYVAAQGPLWSFGRPARTVQDHRRRRDVGRTFCPRGRVHRLSTKYRMDPRESGRCCTLHDCIRSFRTVAAVDQRRPGNRAIFRSPPTAAKTWREADGWPARRSDKGKIGHGDLGPAASGCDLRHDRACRTARAVSFAATDGGEQLGEAQRLRFGRNRPALLPGDLRLPATTSTASTRWTCGLHVSDDGGKNFRAGTGEKDKHGDNHAIGVQPQ